METHLSDLRSADIEDARILAAHFDGGQWNHAAVLLRRLADFAESRLAPASVEAAAKQITTIMNSPWAETASLDEIEDAIAEMLRKHGLGDRGTT